MWLYQGSYVRLLIIKSTFCDDRKLIDNYQFTSMIKITTFNAVEVDA